ncbi:MAG: phosphoenolpyruvate synthase [Deltaproteobacteria bacterium]|nr:phosphoenolpyruvate synthase [Deltaproteobacteria bacterium]
MVETFNLFRNLYRRWKQRRDRGKPREISEIFRFKYALFRDLLDSNSQLLNLITDVEEKLQGREVFGMSYVRSQATRAAFHAFRMVKSLDVLSGHRHPALYAVLEDLNRRIQAVLESGAESRPAAWVLPYSRITKEMVDWVGGKNANLGEVVNRVGLPTPGGFAITTRAFADFLAANDLVEEINKRKMEMEALDPESIRQLSEAIQALILDAALPPDLESAILGAYDALAAQAAATGRPAPLVSLRSSAIGEDSELSFAGQYLTVLNVPRERLLAAYREVVASLYSSRALAYRLHKGVRDEDSAMSVACLEMVPSVASGVMYSRHPFDVLKDHVVITAVFGLGPYAVDGVITPDTYVVAKDRARTLLETHVSSKPVQLEAGPQGGLRETPVPPAMQEAPCLTPEQRRILADYAIRLEEHYQCPQDVEWALDPGGRLLVLQTRPLHLEARTHGESAAPALPGYPVLLEGAAVACPGVGCGPACLVHGEEDLLHFPEGGVLVARHSSPKFVLVMPRAQAIVTESGSVAGHMAAVAREFGVPTLLDAHTATRALTPGQEVTVDAYAGRVYRGRVPELLALKEVRQPHMRDTPVYQILKQVANLMVPLTLVDPKAPEFKPENCRSLHDIARLVHEISYTEMFRVSDLVTERGGGAVRLCAPIPLDLFLIDLGEGLTSDAAGKEEITEEMVVCAPLQALLKGLTFQGLRGLEPRPVQLSGLFSVMREQWLSAPPAQERFGDRSYAIVSRKYLNFSSRVGYHYCVIDAYCGDTVNKNYITFSFKGGAADDVRRNRRARSIAVVLVALDFAVDVKGDRVDARFQKYPGAVIAEKLELLGRLLIFTRQMDMLMTGEVSVEALAHAFLSGDYRLEGDNLGGPRG